MTELYRLRSIDRLLGDSQELEKQAIYFASPRRGLMILWKASEIFFGKEIKLSGLICSGITFYCLHITCLLIQMGGGEQ